jgi:hypothetical protein
LTWPTMLSTIKCMFSELYLVLLTETRSFPNSKFWIFVCRKKVFTEAGEVINFDFYSTRHLAVVEYSTEEEALNVTNLFLWYYWFSCWYCT